MIRTLILAALGGVRLQDAIEAVCYERQRPVGERANVLSPGAYVIWRRADRVDAEARRPSIFPQFSVNVPMPKMTYKGRS